MTAFTNENTTVTTGPIDGSVKAHPPGPDGVDVAVRRIGLTNGTSFDVYDTSGPYTDDTAAIDVHAGLPRLRQAWVDPARGTQLERARAGQVTTEMRYIALREGVEPDVAEITLAGFTQGTVGDAVPASTSSGSSPASGASPSGSSSGRLGSTVGRPGGRAPGQRRGGASPDRDDCPLLPTPLGRRGRRASRRAGAVNRRVSHAAARSPALATDRPL